MDEQNKQPEQNKPEKKLSRTTLTFYIVGLFSVAIALILISYVAQSRADKQVENLSSQLTQQQTVAQGATRKWKIYRSSMTYRTLHWIRSARRWTASRRQPM